MMTSPILVYETLFTKLHDKITSLRLSSLFYMANNAEYCIKGMRDQFQAPLPINVHFIIKLINLVT